MFCFWAAKIRKIIRMYKKKEEFLINSPSFID